MSSDNLLELLYPPSLNGLGDFLCTSNNDATDISDGITGYAARVLDAQARISPVPSELSLLL